MDTNAEVKNENTSNGNGGEGGYLSGYLSGPICCVEGRDQSPLSRALPNTVLQWRAVIVVTVVLDTWLQS